MRLAPEKIDYPKSGDGPVSQVFCGLIGFYRVPELIIRFAREGLRVIRH